MTVDAIAHRGEPVGERENTLPAFAAAVALGADMVELDLRLTSDGVVVVLHDQTLARLWGRDADVGDMTLADVQELGHGEVRIPTLVEVLVAVPQPAHGRLHPTRGGGRRRGGGAGRRRARAVPLRHRQRRGPAHAAPALPPLPASG